MSYASKYPPPNVGLFQYIWCPHYAAEMLIYIALAAMIVPISLPPPSPLHQPSLTPTPSSDDAAMDIKRMALHCIASLLSSRFLAAVAPYSAWLLAVWVAFNLSATAARSKAWYVSEALRARRTDREIRALQDKCSIVPGIF